MSHKAIIAKVTQTIPILGADKIHIAIVLGERVIVSKDVVEGSVGVFFPVDVQLSEEYCHENNLFRKAHLNKNPEKTGFFEENRRVRAQPFLKVRSEGLFMPLESLSYLVYTHDEMSRAKYVQLGTEFDNIEGNVICCKYVSQATRDAIAKQNRPKQKKRAETPYFEKHQDSAQFKHNAAMIPVGALIYFHAKVHGTSHRNSYTKVFKELPKWKQLVNKVVPVFPEYVWDHVVGTRNVVLTTPEKEGFHGSEAFRFEVAEMLKPHMKKGMTIYGEIAGYANGKPIMAVHSGDATKNKDFVKKYGKQIVYKYGCAEHEYRFHVYRITYLTEEGENVDFTQPQLEQWCKERGINPTFEVRPPMIYNGNLEALMSEVEHLTENYPGMSADYIDPSHPGEGIILRIETGNMQPYFLKSKAFHFRCMEGLAESVDTEDAA
jgi:hypothetical protein